MKGISHLTFIVHDLARMKTFLCDGLGAEEICDSAGHEFSLSAEKFFLLGGVWIAAMQRKPAPERSYAHCAFAVERAELRGYRRRLQAIGVEIAQGWSRVEDEGASLYFHDFDNPLFELHAGDLSQRLARYRHAS